MGCWTVFTCDTCAYSARVSGGKDRGFAAFIETMTCDDCSKVVDVVVGLAEEFSGALVKSEGGNIGECTICKGRNVRAWNPEERPCPRCEGKMVRGEEDVWFWD